MKTQIVKSKKMINIYHTKTSQNKARMAISEKQILKQRIFPWIKKKGDL